LVNGNTRLAPTTKPAFFAGKKGVVPPGGHRSLHWSINPTPTVSWSVWNVCRCSSWRRKTQIHRESNSKSRGKVSLTETWKLAWITSFTISIS